MDRLRLARPSVGEEELSKIDQVLATGYLTQGPVVAEFESLVAKRVGTKHAFATSSATTALHLSLVALEVGPGDEVIVPAFTFPATANVVVQLGAKPVLADIDLSTFAVTVDRVEPALSSRTAAVMPVDVFGFPAPMSDLCSLASDNGVRVVEDAACAIGASRAGKECGSFPDVGCLSFHPRKVITTGEGGMITTDDDDLAERIALLRNHGGSKSGGRFSYEAAGFNYRLSDVAGAIGVVQMGKLATLLELRRQRAEQLTKQLNEIEGVRPPVSEDDAVGTYQAYVALLSDRIDRDRVIAGLDALGVESTIGTYGIHLEPYYRHLLGTAPEMFPNATVAARQSIALPMFPDMSEADVDRVATAVADVIGTLA